MMLSLSLSLIINNYCIQINNNLLKLVNKQNIVENSVTFHLYIVERLNMFFPLTFLPADTFLVNMLSFRHAVTGPRTLDCNLATL